MDEPADLSASRRKRIRIAALLAGAVILGAAYWLTRPEEGFIVGIAPISDDESFVLMRANYDTGPASGWLIRMRKDGHRVFTTELPAAPDATGDAHGLVTDGRVVVVLTGNGNDRTTIVALSARTGRILFRQGQAGRSYNGIFLTANDFVGVFDSERHGPVVIGLSLSDGTRRFSHRPTNDIGVAIVDQAHRVLAYRDMGWRVVSLGSGSSVRVPSTLGDACLLDRAMYGLSEGNLVRTRIDGPVPTTDARPLTPSEPAIGYAHTCGARGDALVFFGQAPVTREAFVLIVGKDGAVRRRIDLGVSERSTLGGERDKDDPRFDPLRGPLSRFVPVILQRADDTHVLVVLDIDRGAIAWTSAPQHDLLHYQVVRGRDDVHYLTSYGHIVTIDGKNGHVLAATRTSMMGIRGFYATRHALWGFSSDWTDIDTLPFVTLDARTLARRSGPNAALPTHTDDRARTLTWLAVPAPYRP